jgi:PilZ domain
MPERRRHRRFPFARHLRLLADPPVGAITVDARDVSERGLSFITDIPFAIGELLILALRRDDSFRVEIKVRNVRRDGVHYIVGAERTSL